MQEIAGWIAPAATMIAAVMTAANLGTRVTGWGFVVFTLGALAWVMVAAATGQTNLLVSNVMLGVVDLVGVWRWLGMRARSEEAAETARGGGATRTALFAATGLEGMKIAGPDGATLGRVAEAMACCRSGRIDHLIVRVGGVAGVGETLHRLDWSRVKVADDLIEVDLDAAGMRRLPRADADG